MGGTSSQVAHSLPLFFSAAPEGGAGFFSTWQTVDDNRQKDQAGSVGNGEATRLHERRFVQAQRAQDAVGNALL